MASTTANRPLNQESFTLANGAQVGFFGGFVFALLLHLVGQIAAIGTLFGNRSVIVGWVAILVLGIVGGVVYTFLLEVDPIADLLVEPADSVAVGLGYGFVLWLFGALVAVPIWGNAIMGYELGFPYIELVTLPGLLIYGGVVGGLYYYEVSKNS